MEFRVKIADQPEEIEQIHRLNYATFVEEIPQHAQNEERRRVDPYDPNNTYVIVLLGEELVGMASLADQRPFSLDKKLEDLDSYLPPHRALCELRLLSVLPKVRGTHVFFRLFSFIKDLALTRGYDLAVISGTTRQTQLYEKIGFCKFGPLVGHPGAYYQPMYLTAEALERSMRKWSQYENQT